LQEWVVTTPEAFFKRFHGEAKMDIAMEVGAHSRWASDLLGRCGHKVVVADHRQLGLITKNDAKSDKRDARTLAQLLRADPRLLSPIEHRAEKLQTDLTVIRMRDNLIETRTRLVTSVRGVVKATGGRLPSGETSSFPQQVSDLIPEPLRPALAARSGSHRSVERGDLRIRLPAGTLGSDAVPGRQPLDTSQRGRHSDRADVHADGGRQGAVFPDSRYRRIWGYGRDWVNRAITNPS